MIQLYFEYIENTNKPECAPARHVRACKQFSRMLLGATLPFNELPGHSTGTRVIQSTMPTPCQPRVGLDSDSTLTETEPTNETTIVRNSKAIVVFEDMNIPFEDMPYEQKMFAQVSNLCFLFLILGVANSVSCNFRIDTNLGGPSFLRGINSKSILASMSCI